MRLPKLKAKGASIIGKNLFAEMLTKANNFNSDTESMRSIKAIIAIFFVLILQNLALAEPKEMVFDLTGSFNGYGDVTGPFWAMLDLKKLFKKQKKDANFSIILDGRSEDILHKLYKCSSLSELEKMLDVKFIKPEEVSAHPKADYLFQLFHGGRRIESFDTHPMSGPHTTVIISDTMHGTKFDEVRKGDRHYYFKPPGIGSERSGIVTSPDILLFQNKTKPERKGIVRNLVKKMPSISKIQSLFDKEGPYSKVKFSFLYGIHNEILNNSSYPEILGQTKEYVNALQKLSNGKEPTLIFTPNKLEDIKQTMTGDSLNILTLDEIKAKKPLENKVYFVPTGSISNKVFTGLMSISDFPVLVEGNSSISTAMRLNTPFVMYRSLWNKPQIKDIVKLEKDAIGSSHYENTYTLDTPTPSDIGNLLATLNEQFGDNGDSYDKTRGEAIAANMSIQTKELSNKLFSVIETVENLKLEATQEERERQINQMVQDTLQAKNDEILTYSILKQADQKREVSPTFYRHQIERLAQNGIETSKLESKMIPSQPNFSIKFELLSGIAPETEEAQTKKILSELETAPKRDILQDPEVHTYLQNHRVYVSMTTSPERMDKIHHVIDSLDLDNVEEVLISLPKQFGRDGSVYTIPQELRNHPKVKFLRVPEDYGPITKMIPAIGYAKSKHGRDDSLVISVDDDIGYPRGAINELIFQSVKNGNTVVSGSGYTFPGDLYSDIHNFPHSQQARLQTSHNVRNVDMVEGWGAIAYPTHFVDLNILKALSNISRQCFASDDLVISFALAIDHAPRQAISNEYLAWQMLKPLPYGLKEDALHQGAGLPDGDRGSSGDHGNRKKYRECFEHLMGIAYNPESGTFRSKDEILRKVNEIYGSGLNPKVKWKPFE